MSTKYQDSVRNLQIKIDADDGANSKFLVNTLARLIETVSPHDVHRAFGAPGDWGYGTPIGDALLEVYKRGPEYAPERLIETRPSGLPTLAEVERFMQYWHEKLQAAKPEFGSGFIMAHTGSAGLLYSAYIWEGSSQFCGKDPDISKAVDRAVANASDSPKKERIIALEKELAELRKEEAA